jgi:hypothetical protein
MCWHILAGFEGGAHPLGGRKHHAGLGGVEMIVKDSDQLVGLWRAGTKF